MVEINNSEKMVVEGKCSRCGTEYNPYQVSRGEKVEEKGFYPDCDCTVEIRLKKWQIPILLGAVSMGIYSERLCSLLVEASTDGRNSLEEDISLDHDSFMWRGHSQAIEKQIKEQTGISLEYIESASRKDAIKSIEKFVKEDMDRRANAHRGPQLKRDWLWRRYFDEDEVS